MAGTGIEEIDWGFIDGLVANLVARDIGLTDGTISDFGRFMDQANVTPEMVEAYILAKKENWGARARNARIVAEALQEGTIG